MAPNAESASPVDFLMVAGDGRDDEIIFKWANALGEEKIVKNVTTVSLGSRNTEANCTITQGVTGKSKPTLKHISLPVLMNLRCTVCPLEALNAHMIPVFP